MWDVFNTVASNIAAPFDVIILLIIGIAGLVFYASDFKTGIVMHFIMFGLAFMYLYFLGETWSRALVLFIIMLVIMTFTLYSNSRVAQVAGGVQ